MKSHTSSLTSGIAMQDHVDDKSVTVVITRTVISGREDDYREWANGISQISARQPGHLGATLRGPTESNEFHIIFRFDTVEHLRSWEQSQERADWTAKLEGIVEGAERIEKYCGLEFLFDSKGAEIPKYRMAIVLIAIVFLMLFILRPVVGMVLTGISPTLQLLITVILQVLLMTYLVMPTVYRLLGRWLRK